MKGGEQHRPNPLISTHTKPECQWITPIPSTALLTNAISYLLVSGIGLNRLKKVDIKEKLKQRGLEYNEKDDRSELTEILKADITKARLKKKIEGVIEISNITESDNKERSKKRIKLSLTQSDGKEIRNFFQLGWALKENQEYGKKGGGKHMSDKVIELLKTFFHSGDINKSERYTAKEMFEELQNNVETGELEVNDIPKLKTIENWISRYSSQHKKAMAKRQQNNE
ncbi:13822_t:CDS:2 [Entrophospora sp. SA101]|nr:13822_t:CDS:2 [Entrophospora sp. SA101]